jgi:hypothetical protein
MADWDECVRIAKCEALGYPNSDGEPRGYIEDFDSVIERAKELFQEQKDDEYEERLEEYDDYIKSPEWKQKRLIILKRDKYRCVMCNKPAQEIHHVNYHKFNSKGEENTCVSLCRRCHKCEEDMKDDDYLDFLKEREEFIEDLSEKKIKKDKKLKDLHKNNKPLSFYFGGTKDGLSK